MNDLQNLIDVGADFWVTRPDLSEDAIDLWEAYWVLSPSRQVGPNGTGYVPLSAVQSYCAIIEETDPTEILWIAKVVTAMDEVYLAFVAEREDERLRNSRTEGR